MEYFLYIYEQVLGKQIIIIIIISFVKELFIPLLFVFMIFVCYWFFFFVHLFYYALTKSVWLTSFFFFSQIYKLQSSKFWGFVDMPKSYYHFDQWPPLLIVANVMLNCNYNYGVIWYKKWFLFLGMHFPGLSFRCIGYVDWIPRNLTNYS